MSPNCVGFLISWHLQLHSWLAVGPVKVDLAPTETEIMAPLWPNWVWGLNWPLSAGRSIIGWLELE